MRNITIILLGLFLVVGCSTKTTERQFLSKKESMTENKKSIHNFKVEDLYGKTFDFATLKGKKIMVVNTASKCGLTPQYKDLQALYEKYQDKGLVIIGFPANNFLFQEPGNNEKIAAFCEKNYGVSFPMMSKISVKGRKIAPIYKFLTQKAENGVLDAKVKWNFQKFLIDEEGFVVKSISPKTSPMTEEVIEWIEKD